MDMQRAIFFSMDGAPFYLPEQWEEPHEKSNRRALYARTP